MDYSDKDKYIDPFEDSNWMNFEKDVDEDIEKAEHDTE